MRGPAPGEMAGEGPRALATAAPFPCRLSLWRNAPGPLLPDEAPGGLNQERVVISFLLLCCRASYAVRGRRDGGRGFN